MKTQRHRVRVRIKKEKPLKKVIIKFFRKHKEISIAALIFLLIFSYLIYYAVWREFNPVKQDPKVILAGEDEIKPPVR